jgi:hypothetical protein
MKKLLLVLALVLPLSVYAQHDMSKMDMGNKPSAAEQKDGPAAASADQQMGHHHMDMGPHMKMTPLRPATKADQQRAAAIAKQTRSAIERYTDVKVAEADGYRMFVPNMKHQKMFHYTNYRYAMEAAFRFDAEHPASLLYQDDGHGGKKLIGAMFTAPKNATPAELEQRVPLSIAQWHAHVNLCLPPRDKRDEMFQKNPRFGLAGSITTKDACDAAGGRFMPQVFGWMVHLYPWESDPQQVWSLEKQMEHRD